jgi:hypothetical protein
MTFENKNTGLKNNDRLLTKCGLSIIKFFPTAHHAQSKSVAVAATADTHAHATPTHLLSPTRIDFKRKLVTAFKLLSFILIIISTTSVWGQIPVVKPPQPYSFPRYDQQNYGGTKTTNQPENPHQYSNDPNERNRQIMNEVDEYVRRQNEQKRLIQEALAELEPKTGKYKLTSRNSKAKQHYFNAFNELNNMLNSGELNLKRAVFLIEHAYDTTLNYERFDRQIRRLSEIVQLQMKKDKVSPNDNIGKIMTLFKFMADTITVYHPALEKNITSYPKTYDFEDFYGIHDYSKMFISKLVRTGKGQCHSLPLLFLILAEEIGAKAYLSTAPEHYYIKFIDKLGSLQNIELTSGMFTSDYFIVQSGYVKSAAIKNKIYMDTLSMRKIILNQFNDLANGYTRKFGFDDFQIQCSERVLSDYPNDILAHMHIANHYNMLAVQIQREYKAKGWGQKEFERDPEAMKIFYTANKLNETIDNLGFAEMPPDIYAKWLNLLQNEDMKQQHIERKQVLHSMIEY